MTLFYDGAANVLNKSPVGVSAVQSDRKVQPCSPGDYNVVLAEVLIAAVQDLSYSDYGSRLWFAASLSRQGARGWTYKGRVFVHICSNPRLRACFQLVRDIFK